jgi:hypothetical protein
MDQYQKEGLMRTCLSRPCRFSKAQKKEKLAELPFSLSFYYFLSLSQWVYKRPDIRVGFLIKYYSLPIHKKHKQL